MHRSHVNVERFLVCLGYVFSTDVISIRIHQNTLRNIIGTNDMILDDNTNRAVSGKI
jgi:hypothetical protein